MSRSILSRDGLRAALSGRYTVLAFALLVVAGGTNAVAVRFRVPGPLQKPSCQEIRNTYTV